MGKEKRMIEFKGDVSKKTKKLIRRLDLFSPLFLFCIPLLMLFVFIVMPVYSMQQFAKTFVENLGLYMAVFAGGVAVIVLSYFLIPITENVPLCIQIAPDGTVTAQNSKKRYVHNMNDVLYVKDLGDHYSIAVRGYLLERGRTLCQKDLLTQGTLEEFEEIYKDKIRRKS